MSNANPQEIRSQQPDDNKEDEQRNDQKPHVLHTVPPIGGGKEPGGERAVPETGPAAQGPEQDRSEFHDNVTEMKPGGARGTAAMDPHTRQEVARKGGLAVSRNKQHMAEIGRKGGQSVSKNREHMAKIGRKGGAASRGQRGSGEQ